MSSGVHNSETPELYAVHPYRLFTVGRQLVNGTDLTPAINSFNVDPRAHDNGGWNQGLMNVCCGKSSEGEKKRHKFGVAIAELLLTRKRVIYRPRCWDWLTRYDLASTLSNFPSPRFAKPSLPFPPPPFFNFIFLFLSHFSFPLSWRLARPEPW